MSMVARPRPAREATPSPAESRRHLKVVEPAPALGRRLVSLLILIALFAILFATVAFHVQLVTGQQEIDRLQRRADAAQATYDARRVEVDNLSAPDRIVARARALGMVNATDPVWLAAPTATNSDGTGGAADELHDYLDVKPYLQDSK